MGALSFFSTAGPLAPAAQLGNRLPDSCVRNLHRGGAGRPGCAGEGVVRALSKKTRRTFGTVKVYFDVSLIAIAALLSLAFFHKLNGVGVGTVVSAVAVGKCVNWINRHVKAVQKIRALAVPDCTAEAAVGQ